MIKKLIDLRIDSFMTNNNIDIIHNIGVLPVITLGENKEINYLIIPKIIKMKKDSNLFLSFNYSKSNKFLSSQEVSVIYAEKSLLNIEAGNLNFQQVFKGITRISSGYKSPRKTVFSLSKDREIFVMIELRGDIEGFTPDLSIYSNQDNASIEPFYYYHSEISLPYHNYNGVTGVNYGVTNISYLQNNNMNLIGLNISALQKTNSYLQMFTNTSVNNRDDISKFTLSEFSITYFRSVENGVIAFIKNKKVIIKKPQEGSIYMVNTANNNEYFIFERSGNNRDKLELKNINIENILKENINVFRYNELTSTNNSYTGNTNDFLSLIVLTRFSKTDKIIKIPFDDFIFIKTLVLTWSMGAIEPEQSKPSLESFNIYLNVYQKNIKVKEVKMEQKNFTTESIYRLGSNKFSDSIYYSIYETDIINIIENPDLRCEIEIELKEILDFGNEIKPIFFPSMYIEGVKVEK